MITNDIAIHYLVRITKVRIQYTSLKILRLIIGYNKCTWSPTISLSIILSKSPIIIFSSNYLFRLIFYVIFEKVHSIILPKALKMLESPMIALLTNNFFCCGEGIHTTKSVKCTRCRTNLGCPNQKRSSLGSTKGAPIVTLFWFLSRRAIFATMTSSLAPSNSTIYMRKNCRIYPSQTEFKEKRNI